MLLRQLAILPQNTDMQELHQTLELYQLYHNSTELQLPARSINFITLNFIATRTGISFDEVGG